MSFIRTHLKRSDLSKLWPNYVDEDQPSEENAKITRKVLANLQQSVDERLVEVVSTYYSVAKQEKAPEGAHYGYNFRDEKNLHDPTIEKVSSPKYFPEEVKESSAKEFSDAIAAMKEPYAFLYSTKLMVMVLDKQRPKVCYACRMSILNAYDLWSPQSEAGVCPNTGKEPRDDDAYVGKFYETTSSHKLGGGWIGVVEYDLPVLSTTLGGYRSVVPMDQTDRYKIRWVNWQRQTNHVDALSGSEIENLVNSQKIIVTDPDKKQSLNRTNTYQPEFDGPAIRSRPISDAQIRDTMRKSVTHKETEKQESVKKIRRVDARITEKELEKERG